MIYECFYKTNPNEPGNKLKIEGEVMSFKIFRKSIVLSLVDKIPEYSTDFLYSAHNDENVGECNLYHYKTKKWYRINNSNCGFHSYAYFEDSVNDYFKYYNSTRKQCFINNNSINIHRYRFIIASIKNKNTVSFGRDNGPKILRSEYMYIEDIIEVNKLNFKIRNIPVLKDLIDNIKKICDLL